MREATTSPVLRCGICARPARGAAAARHPWVNLWPRLCAACRRWLPDLDEPQRAAIIAEHRRQQAGYCHRSLFSGRPYKLGKVYVKAQRMAS